jgi:hypothetical protein
MSLILLIHYSVLSGGRRGHHQCLLQATCTSRSIGGVAVSDTRRRHNLKAQLNRQVHITFHFWPQSHTLFAFWGNRCANRLHVAGSLTASSNAHIRHRLPSCDRLISMDTKNSGPTPYPPTCAKRQRLFSSKRYPRVNLCQTKLRSCFICEAAPDIARVIGSLNIRASDEEQLVPLHLV